jgi:D-lactate dehydrogenase
MLRVKVFSARQYDRNFLSGAVKEHKECGVEWDFEERALSAETAETAKGFEGVCLFVNDTLTGETARAMYGEGLRLVLLRCAGFDGVDTKTCAELGVRVMRVPSYSPPAVAEFAVASLLSFVRHLPRAVARAREQNFALDGLLGFTLHGKTVGVIGTGGIGQVSHSSCACCIFNCFYNMCLCSVLCGSWRGLGPSRSWPLT